MKTKERQKRVGDGWWIVSNGKERGHAATGGTATELRDLGGDLGDHGEG